MEHIENIVSSINVFIVAFARLKTFLQRSSFSFSTSKCDCQRSLGGQNYEHKVLAIVSTGEPYSIYS